MSGMFLRHISRNKINWFCSSFTTNWIEHCTVFLFESVRSTQQQAFQCSSAEFISVALYTFWSFNFVNAVVAEASCSGVCSVRPGSGQLYLWYCLCSDGSRPVPSAVHRCLRHSVATLCLDCLRIASGLVQALAHRHANGLWEIFVRCVFLTKLRGVGGRGERKRGGNCFFLPCWRIVFFVEKNLCPKYTVKDENFWW